MRHTRVENVRMPCWSRPHINRSGRRAFARTVLAGLLAASASGCAVGPNFTSPAAPEVKGFLPGKLSSPNPGAGGPRVASQHFVNGADVSARWWAAFQSSPLNDLVRQSVERNPTLQAAEAAIKVAQHNALAQRGLYFPQITGNSTPSSLLLSNAGNIPPGEPLTSPQTRYSLVTNQLTVTFVPDIWGANFRAVESLEAVAQQELFQLEAAYLALTSNVVAAAIQEASLRGQIAATQRIVRIERNLLDILKRQFNFGQTAQADVLAQEAALAQAEQLLPPLQKQLAQQRDLLTALAGRYSADEIAQKFDLAHFKLPANLPVSLPSKLVAQRPDVRAAEANMHAASAQVGVAIAARLRTSRYPRMAARPPITSRRASRPVPVSIRSPQAPLSRSSMAFPSITSRRLPKRHWSRPKPCIGRPLSPRSRTSPTRSARYSSMRRR